MKFKDFEIRPCKDANGKDEPYKYEIVKWYDHAPYIHGQTTCTRSCYTVAWLEWIPSEPCWDIKSVGLRLLKDWVDGLDEFIIKWCDLMNVCIEKGDEDDE